MTKKIEISALYIMVVAHIIYDWAIPFVHKDFHALFASSWNATLFGYICVRLVYDVIKSSDIREQKAKGSIAFYFFWRAFLNFSSFMQSFKLEESWERYQIVTSNYYADALIWTIIAVILIKLYWKDIYALCRKSKII